MSEAPVPAERDARTGFRLFIGGTRSGKSSLAQSFIEAHASAIAASAEVSIVVTASAPVSQTGSDDDGEGDNEMAERIARHQADRPASWHTVEAPRALAAAVAAVPGDHLLLLDCVTLWISNEILADAPNETIETEARELAAILAARTAPTAVVSNEVGYGIVPMHEMSRRFRDVHGRVNRTLAVAAGAAYLVVAGQVLPLAAPGDLSEL